MGQDPVVRRLREEIAENDRAMVEALNRRITLVAELHGHKVARGYDLVDTSRESWLVRHLSESNAGPLSPAGLRQFVLGLLDLTKREVSGG